MFDEHHLHVVGDGIVVFRLIVYLIADDARLLCHVGDEGSDHPLAVMALVPVYDVNHMPRPLVGYTGRTVARTSGYMATSHVGTA